MPNNVEWAATLKELSKNGNQVALDPEEAQEIAALLTAPTTQEGGDNGEGA